VVKIIQRPVHIVSLFGLVLFFPLRLHVLEHRSVCSVLCSSSCVT